MLNTIEDISTNPEAITAIRELKVLFEQILAKSSNQQITDKDPDPYQDETVTRHPDDFLEFENDLAGLGLDRRKSVARNLFDGVKHVVKELEKFDNRVTAQLSGIDQKIASLERKLKNAKHPQTGLIVRQGRVNRT